jgi:hypothetical protein
MYGTTGDKTFIDTSDAVDVSGADIRALMYLLLRQWQVGPPPSLPTCCLIPLSPSPLLLPWSLTPPHLLIDTIRAVLLTHWASRIAMYLVLQLSQGHPPPSPAHRLGPACP